MAWSKEKQAVYQREYVKANKARIAEYKRDWYLAHKPSPEKTKWYRRYRHSWASWKSRKGYSLFRKYGINEEQYSEMYRQQDGKCMICKESREVLSVDHCHETKIIRGLLCEMCNKGLGLFRDSGERLEAAKQYLEESKNVTPIGTTVTVSI